MRTPSNTAERNIEKPVSFCFVFVGVVIALLGCGDGAVGITGDNGNNANAKSNNDKQSSDDDKSSTLGSFLSSNIVPSIITGVTTVITQKMRSDNDTKQERFRAEEEVKKEAIEACLQLKLANINRAITRDVSNANGDVPTEKFEDVACDFIPKDFNLEIDEND